MTTAAEQPITLPTVRLLGAAWLACAVVGGGWMGVAVLLGHGVKIGQYGLLGAAAVAVAALLSVLVLKPWKPRELVRWPSAWMLGSAVRFAAAFGAGYLLYSSPLIEADKVFWVALGASYVAAMVVETKIYAGEMKAFGPDRVAASGTPLNQRVDPVSSE